MAGWEYCRLDVLFDDPDGGAVVVAYFRDPPEGERVLFQDPPDADHAVDPIVAGIFTLGLTLDRLGSEGWEAIQTNEDGSRWFFKRARED